MSVSRLINSSFYIDEWVCELDPSEKFMYLYLITNDSTNICGVYKTSKKRIAMDTGFNTDTVGHILSRFERDKKAYFYDGYIIIPSFPKNQKLSSPKLKQGVENLLRSLPDNIIEKLIEVNYSYDLSCVMDRVSKEYAYSTINSNSNSNLNSNTHTINQIQCVNEIPQNDDAEEEICVCENPFSQTSTESETSEVVETQKINQTYAEKVYETWHENKLPEGNGGFIAFLQRDFKTGISELRQQRLHSDDVIQAIKNYALVLNNSCYFWSAAFYFSDFVKQKNITRFLPERFNAEMYLDKSTRWDSAVKKSGSDVFTGELPF